MTYLKKAKELRPELTERDIIDDFCPWTFGLEQSGRCKLIQKCNKCWNREIPNKTEEETKS